MESLLVAAGTLPVSAGTLPVSAGTLLGAGVAAAYGLATGVLARRWLATGRHRRYPDERTRPLSTYRFLPVLLAVAAALLAARLASAGPAVAGGYVALLPLYAVLAAVDLDVHRLPDIVTLPAYPAAATVLAVAALTPGSWPGHLARAALAGAATAAAFATLHLLSRGQLGRGDVKLSGSLGMLLGWFGWDRLLGGVYAMFLAGGAAALWLMARRRAARSSRLAFGPAMVAGWALALLVGAPPPT